jgi:hypothetical protein
MNDSDMLGVSFEDVQTILKDMVANCNDGVKFRMMDKTFLTASQAGHVTAVSIQPERALPSSSSLQAGHTTEAATSLVNTDDEEDDYPDTIGTSFRMQHLQHGQGAKCVCCNNTILSTVNCTSCDSCQGMMHGKCAFHALEQDAFAIFCTRCNNGKRQFCKGLLDLKLSATFGRTPGTTYDYNDDFKYTQKEKIWIKKINSFNSWLTTVDEIKYSIKKRGGYECYQGRPKNDDGNSKEIHDDLIKDQLFQLFPNELCRIKLNKNHWFELSPTVKEFIRLHGICYSNDLVFDSFFHTERQEWQYIKFNTWNQSSVIPGYNYKIIDDASIDEQNHEGTAWLSFTNDTRRAAITMIPLYYLKRWEICCAKDRVPGSQTEYDNVLLEAKDFANSWIEIPQGSSKQNYFNIDFRNIHHLPKSFRIQRPGENSCVFNSLGNALHYINDYHGRDAVFDQLNKSLDYSEYREFAKTRRKFAAYVMNFCVKGYNAKLLTNLDVLNDRTMWPTLCILKGDDNSTNHAVTIVEDYIFDSNNSYALPLNESTLNWCCSGDTAESEVKFVSVPFAYRFNVQNPPPQLVLRHESKNTCGVQAVICSLLEINDSVAASSLEEYKTTVTPDQDVTTRVREILHSSIHQYVPLKLKDFNDVLLQASENYPTIFLVHLKDTFKFAIFSSIGNQYFDGICEESNILTYENLCNSLDRNSVAKFGTFSPSRLVVLKGYVFTKKEKKSLKWNKRKVGGTCPRKRKHL